MLVQFLVKDPRLPPASECPDVPPFCESFLLPYAARSYTIGSYGSFLSQEIEGQDYSICEYRFFIREKVDLLPCSREPLLTLVYILKGSISCYLEGFGEVELAEGKYYFFYVPAGVGHEASFREGDYVILHITLSPGYLHELADSYPSINALVKMHEKEAGSGMQDLSAPMTLRTRVIIEQIKQCRECENARDMFLRAKIYELLVLFSKDSGRTIPGVARVNRPNHVYAGKMMQAKYILDTNLGPPVSIAALGRELGINGQLLKREFKNAFDITIYAYQLQLRMERACELLLRPNTSINAVAEEVGYRNTSSFIEKFHELFGLTPLRYHKRYNK